MMDNQSIVNYDKGK